MTAGGDNVVQVRNLNKSFDGRDVIRNVSFDIKRGEFVTILGPSGCGKSTLLRMIGGFSNPDSGEILIDGKSVVGVPANKRPVNTVFQNYCLFPHLNVYRNVEYGLLAHRVPKSEREDRVMNALSSVGMSDFRDGNVSQLSGGQQQRVAIARAVVNRPEVLLLDESLSALDMKLRKEMQHELKKLQRTLGITFLFVTHDQEEAVIMSDRIILMNNGMIEQTATPCEIYDHPSSLFAARFIGDSNLVDVDITAPGTVRIFGYETKINGASGLRQGEKATAVIRPEDIRLSSSNLNEYIWQGTITSCIFCGVFYDINVIIDGYDNPVRVRKYTEYREGTRVGVGLYFEQVHIIGER